MSLKPALHAISASELKTALHVAALNMHENMVDILLKDAIGQGAIFIDEALPLTEMYTERKKAQQHVRNGMPLTADDAERLNSTRPTVTINRKRLKIG